MKKLITLVGLLYFCLISNAQPIVVKNHLTKDGTYNKDLVPLYGVLVGDYYIVYPKDSAYSIAEIRGEVALSIGLGWKIKDSSMSGLNLSVQTTYTDSSGYNILQSPVSLHYFFGVYHFGDTFKSPIKKPLNDTISIKIYADIKKTAINNWDRLETYIYIGGYKDTTYYPFFDVAGGQILRLVNNPSSIPLISSSFLIYPNPAKDRVYVNTTKPWVGKLVDQKEGRVVRYIFGEKYTVIKKNNLSPGVYYLFLNEGGFYKIIFL